MKYGLIAAAEHFASRAAHALEHHPKHVTALIAALMLGGGGGAFAVASATARPDPAALPVRQILETVQPAAIQPQLDALDAHPLQLFRSELTRATDTAESLLARLGVNDPAAAAFLRANPVFRTEVLGRVGRTVSVETSGAQALQKLGVRWVSDDSGRFNRFVAERGAQGQFTARVEAAPLVASLRMGSGTVRGSLFAATDAASIPDTVAQQLTEVFGTDIDFNRGLRSGDRFSLVYEVLEADGEPMRTGRIVSAEFVNGGRSHAALWYQEPGKKGGYFDFSGHSLERSFLASPVEVSRITSTFSMRFHPVLHTWKAHLGVDYGAPEGAAVRTIGDGMVMSVGEQNGYGNVIVVDHGKGETTLYAHLSRFDVQAGQKVSRGQRIGAVGQTGWATGPHLHFEFRENGEQRDPLTMAQQSQNTELSPQARANFEASARRLRAQLAAAASTTTVASRD
ncbi:M23 family metallopeptidase [Ramlibacter sp.]|uniref:M23 family metallopeptidase n=1 Tax=Ramlibacter sp. TaxID=1917967 RepID=UPI0025F77D39|nr:M23 family metallopeptidase [Ramlibacter sp.]